MAYCSKCGQKLEEGDAYCPNCGTRMKNIDTNAEHKNRPNINMDLQVLAKIFINMFVKPVTTAKNFINSGRKNTTIILTVFTVVVNGLLGMWKVNQIVSNINDVAIKFINKIVAMSKIIDPSLGDSLSNSDMNEITAGLAQIKAIIKIPYGQVFVQNCVLILISIVVIFIILCVSNAILSKNKPEVFKFYKTALIIAMPVVYFKFLSIIFSYASVYLGIILALLGLIISLVCFTMSVNESLKISQNHAVFVVSFTVLIVIIVQIACLQKFILSFIASIVESIMYNIKALNL
ncbi:zinc-ribbon domain-containing protein [Clostridium tyrobutyricum]|uniref:Predicted metal-binding membrane protein n=1 Tax=Clostridium tyrobutyricum DIVETGP TaxID=1408889 RepID=W6N6E7_CLOTY|nr:zinc ribbon domain-containing protein [Clostridium tyrobutyricum]AND83783.1 metal-binding membrane protein [Clostridium tyrobutyricum]ANP68543.1 metal-binding protein [Clostridium tyrobutyricum]MBV4435088.1 zinc ribbon domain-containing protein [Clostridium tyrobutyricum]QNB67113.1 zinc-ribbon domain-containing protein [Clostridium tyrobutyricum]CDL92218.1 Predicted metal-binding membrane protein [Clostridium tyrobutyricum DIVETGP]